MSSQTTTTHSSMPSASQAGLRSTPSVGTQAEAILTRRTRWTIWAVSGVLLLLLYGTFLAFGCQKTSRANLDATPELLSQVFMEATGTNATGLTWGTAGTLAGVALGAHLNTSLTQQQKVATVVPMVGTAIAKILLLEPPRVATVFLRLAAKTPRRGPGVPPQLVKSIRDVLLGGGALSETQFVSYVAAPAMGYLRGATLDGVDPQAMFHTFLGIEGLAFATTVGIDRLVAALPTFGARILGAIYAREKPRLSEAFYLSLGPVAITYVLLLLCLVPVLSLQHHFVVRKRGRFYLYQVFFSSFLVIAANVSYSFFFAWQDPDTMIKDRPRHRTAEFCCMLMTILTGNLFFFALVQRLDMMYQAFVRGKTPGAAKLSPYSYFRMSWLYFVCCTISTVPTIFWFFIVDPTKDTLRSKLHWLTLSIFVNFFIYIALIIMYVVRLKSENGTKRFLDFTETLRHLIYQTVGFTACIGVVTFDTKLHTPTFVILTYFWAYSISWFVIDAFSLPVYIYIRTKFTHQPAAVIYPEPPRKNTLGNIDTVQQPKVAMWKGAESKNPNAYSQSDIGV